MVVVGPHTWRIALWSLPARAHRTALPAADGADVVGDADGHWIMIVTWCASQVYVRGSDVIRCVMTATLSKCAAEGMC